MAISRLALHLLVALLNSIVFSKSLLANIMIKLLKQAKKTVGDDVI